MKNLNIRELYKNSLLHFSSIKEINTEDIHTNIILTILDRRFIKNKNIDEIKFILPYCRIKILDDYWIAIYSSYFLNYESLFNKLLEQEIIVDIYEFLRIVGG